MRGYRMSEKTKKVSYCRCHLQHLDRVEEFLEQKAKEGWFVYKYIGSLFYFKKGKPKDIRYYAGVFEKEKWNNSYENKTNKDFIEKCKEKGWKFIYANSKFQLFSTEQKGAPRPKISEEKKVESIYKAYFKEYFYLVACMFFLVCCNILTGLLGIVRMLTSFSQFIYVMAWVIFAVYLLCYMWVNNRWYKKARMDAKLNRKIAEFPRTKLLKVALGVIMLLLGISIIGFFVENKTFQAEGAFNRCMLLFVLVGILCANLLVKAKKKIALHISVSLAVCVISGLIYCAAYYQTDIFQKLHQVTTYSYEDGGKTKSLRKYEDEIPITLNDFDIQKDSQYEYSTYHEVDGQFMIKKDYYSEEPVLSTVDNEAAKEPALYYIVYRTNSKYLYRRILTDECYNGSEASTYDILENTDFKAKKIYKKKLDDKYYEYIFLFDDAIIEVNITSELSEKQLAKIDNPNK